MTRGRKPPIDPPRSKKCSIPGSVMDRVEEVLTDPMTGKPAYGAFSDLVTRLLKEWLLKITKPLEEKDP